MAKLSNSPKQALNFDLERRKSFTFRVRLKYSDGSLVNLTGCTLRFVMKSAGAVDDHFDLNNLVVNSEATIGAPLTGEGVFAFQAAELDGDPGEYDYSIVLWSPDNFSTVLAKGFINLLDNSESHSMHRLYSATAPTSALELTLRGGDVVEVEVVSLPQVPVPIDAISWPDVGAKPESFPPSTHGHTINEVTGLATELAGKQPAGNYAASVHQHTVSDVNGLQGALDGKSPTSHNHDGTYAPDTHTHTIAQVTGLQGALDAKAASSHGHTIANVTGLQGALDGKQPAGSYASSTHTHLAENITDWAEAVQDTVAAMLVSGANVTLTYDDAAGKVTDTAAGGDAEVMRDTIGAALVGVNGVSVAVNDAADTITLSVSGLTSTQISDSTAVGRSLLTSPNAAAARAAISAAPELGPDDNYVTNAEKVILGNTIGTNTGDQDLSGYLTTSAAPELIRDTMGSALVAGANVTITPNDAGDTITIAASGGGGGGIDTESVQDVVGAMIAGAGGTYDDAAGTITLPSGGGGGGGGSVALQGGPISQGLLLQPMPLNGNSATEANTHTMLSPYPIERQVTIDALAARTTSTVAGASVQVALYNSTADGLPGSRVAMTALMPAATAGLTVGTLASAVTLAPGLYWIGVYSLGGWYGVGTNFQTSSHVFAPTGWYRTGDPLNYNAYRIGYSVSGSPPETFPNPPAATLGRSTPIGWVRAQ